MNYSDKKVLIVDDDYAFATFLIKLIKMKLGAITIHAPDPEVALQKMKLTDYDLIILDMEMPVLDGYSTLKLIRSDDKTQDIPVIVCSAIINNMLIGSLSKLNIEAFIIKPSNSNIILKKIEKVLSSKNGKTEND